MNIIEPSAILEGDYDYEDMLLRVERAGRTCYKSDKAIAPGSAETLIRNIIAREHYSVLEHAVISVRFICDRGVSHELVRHRLASFSQESTRYVNYGGTQIGFVNPLLDPHATAYVHWQWAMKQAERAYKLMLDEGCAAQIARSVLPNSLKTELVMTMNLRTWRHFFNLRCDKTAHPQMRQLTLPLFDTFCERFPVFFETVTWKSKEKPGDAYDI